MVDQRRVDIKHHRTFRDEEWVVTEDGEWVADFRTPDDAERYGLMRSMGLDTRVTDVVKEYMAGPPFGLPTGAWTRHLLDKLTEGIRG